jgi:hypothetical protein
LRRRVVVAHGSTATSPQRLSFAVVTAAPDNERTLRSMSKALPLRRNIDHARHANRAVRSTKVRKSTRLRKSVLINRAYVGKRSRRAIGIVRGTKLSIDRARIAAGNTMATAGPSPPNRVAHMNVERIRHKREALSHRDIENPVRWHFRAPPRSWTRARSWSWPRLAVWHLVAVLVHDLYRLSRSRHRSRAPVRA